MIESFKPKAAAVESSRLWQPAAFVVIVLLSTALLGAILSLAWLTLGLSSR